MKRHQFLLLLILLFITVLFGCKQEEKQTVIETEDENKSELIAAQVNRFQITMLNVDQKVQVEKAYGNKDANRTIALVLMLNDAIEQGVFEQNNLKLSQTEIYRFDIHSSKSSKAPEILKEIRNIYSNDSMSYKNWFLAPKIINQKLHGYFSRNKEIHAQQIRLIEQAYSNVIKGQSFKSTAIDLKLQYSMDSVSFDEPTRSDFGFKDQASSNLAIFNSLKNNEIFNQILESDNDFSIIKLLNKQGNKYIIESISMQKSDYDSWFMNEAKKLKIQIFDKNLLSDIQLNFPDLWYLDYLN